MEVRLVTRAKITQVMRKIGAEHEPTFAALFDASLAKDVLLLFWSDIRNQTLLLGQVQAQRPEDLLAVLAGGATAPIRPGQLLQRLGRVVLVGSIGFRGARAAIGRHCGARSWQRYKKELKSLSMTRPVGFSALHEVGTALEAFAPLRMEDLSNAANRR